MEVALKHLKKFVPLSDRILRRYRRFEPAVRVEVERLIQFAFFNALSRIPKAGERERIVVDTILQSLYVGIQLDSLPQRIPDYLSPQDAPPEVFVRNIYERVGTHRKDFEFHAIFTLHIHRMLNSLIELFIPVIQGFAENDKYWGY